MESPICPSGTRLIETFRWDGHSFQRLNAHLDRARTSAMALGFTWNESSVDTALATVTGTAPLRVRLTLGQAGDAEVTTGALAATPAEWRVIVAPERLRSSDIWLRHKTTQRALYDRTRAALPLGIDEVLFLNEQGEVCEGTITNLFYDLGHGLMTPPQNSGCLPGILRQEMLATRQCAEAPLAQTDLNRATLWMGNALRGLIPARLAFN
ncbi:MAG: aminotransferase class IV family protein [Albidovulum sp.]